MNQPVTITKEPLSPELAEQLIALSALWEGEDSCFGYRTNTLEDLKGQDIFLAREDGQLLGYLLCHCYTQEKDSCTVPRGSRCLEIEELYILPQHRSQGLGRALYQTATDSFGDAVEYVTLSTATKNYKAILHFYIDELGMTFWNARLLQKRS